MIKKMTIVVTLAAAAIGIAPAAAHASREPTLHLARPTGPYAVGRSTLHLVDQSRLDPWVPESGPRQLMVSLYYPAVPGTGRPAAYSTTDEARPLLERLDATDLISPEAFAATRTYSRTDALPIPGTHPLVVLSPGMTLPRYTISSLAEELTSRGYVTATVDHAYESLGTSFPEGVLTCAACDTAKSEAGGRAVQLGRAATCRSCSTS
jgi:predicted dienelactone hydrolase